MECNHSRINKRARQTKSELARRERERKRWGERRRSGRDRVKWRARVRQEVQRGEMSLEFEGECRQTVRLDNSENTGQ